MPETVVEKFETAGDPKMVKPFPKKSPKVKGLLINLGISLVVVILGILTGWKLSNSGVASNKAGTKTAVTASNASNQMGVKTEGEDCAQGVMKDGGIKGEGTFHLDRDLGVDKYVYLTSTAVDLGGMVEKKVEVCGKTIKAKYAGWLMDVTSVKTL